MYSRFILYLNLLYTFLFACLRKAREQTAELSWAVCIKYHRVSGVGFFLYKSPQTGTIYPLRRRIVLICARLKRIRKVLPHYFVSKQPDAVLRIKTPTDVGRRAYSKFEIDINPASLCSRIISVREQIANELCGDLKAISTMGQLIFSSYHYNKENQNNTKSSGKKGGIGYKDGTSPNGIDKPSMLYMNFDPLIDSPFAPSPLRKGNFDLLYNLITQEAVVDLLRNGVFVGDDEIQNEASLRYLEKFYRDRVVTHFVGAQFYWKGDEFIEEMMLASPIVMFDDFDESAQEDADTSEIEPLRVAEQVLLRRDALALEWLEIMQAVPSHHAAIRKAQLDRMMGQGPAVEEQTDTKVIVTTDDFQ